MPSSSQYFGLTGGVASGKSTVARMFQAAGAKVIDADQIGHELQRSPLPAYQEIVRHFGKEILDPKGGIDRRRLGSIVFADGIKLGELNAILHPLIIERVEELAAEHRAASPRAIVLVDAALIYEVGIGGRFRKMVVAWCRPELQLERLMSKANLSRPDAERRIASQLPAEEKRRRADFLIDTSGSLEETRAQVETVYPDLKRIAGG